ncbi:grasp-with-spasm system SPASM domain peptide maturase [Flavobacteriaceae bacterium KMM 6898]|nr:grasp-with-spasm system SPASM domain peptide maturase [Flavobacteriaceae bacterium KMM 6898]
MKFKLFANCIIVRGYSRSTLCDFQRYKTFIVSNEIAEIINKMQGKTYEEIIHNLNIEQKSEIDDCLKFLLDNELGFYTDIPDSFPDLSLEWDYPFEISNAIMDISSNSKYDIFRVMNQLEDINCEHLQIRYFKRVCIKDLQKILDYLDERESIISSIDLIFSLEDMNTKEAALNLRKNSRISSLTIYGSNEDRFISPYSQNKGYAILTRKIIDSDSHCGLIDPQLFVVNLKMFTESLKHNSCLNRKVSIDVNGNIKNCPSMLKDYGSVINKPIIHAIKEKGFKDLWNITKDEVLVCQDCEFRRICTDCRAFTEIPDNVLSKPLKCGYSPYKNEWENWSSNPLKQEAIKYYKAKA